MMKTTLLAFWLFASCAFGQLLPNSAHQVALLNQRVAGGSSFVPTDISGMKYFWKYTDLANGVVDTWTDSIVGVVSGQATASRKPTNTVSGVYFNGAQMLTNGAATVSVGTNFTIWIAMSFSSVATDQTLYCIDEVRYTGFYLSSQQLNAYDNANAFVSGTIVAGRYDFIYNNNTGAAWTNSVSSGSRTGWTTTPWQPNAIGAANSAASGLVGYIKFLGIWTNSLSSADVLSLYNYATSH